ncbi:hypothetical protein T440DRAFT_483016 [Plenodomus tracheiphilus IPT5]|uniref:Low temperature requirement A n=1 Tax=Plenodomus tracheiphilus IPT5 TaxID=1408161 RepID=A0A6A7AUE1_9PLEO|nr:hypothetical protein T440DRAFT_483016 [Plenodomus tracheiphilus IPT5]
MTATSPPPDPKSHTATYEHNDNTSRPIVPWFPSPIDGWDKEQQCFAPRHMASTIELFFDLWFVANLATFTQYHAITNRYTFWSYVAFFFVLWTSWFHVVCFDARFTSDSVWERACKTVHFCSFAALALVGYKFAPVARDVQDATPHWVYRVMCFALLLSRVWLALQYVVTAVSCSSAPHRELRLMLPLLLNAALFLSVAGILSGMFMNFANLENNLTAVLIGMYAVLFIEFFGSLSISMIWQRLSFKATHIGERLGLLGLIIIGEGVIGTTKTITRTLGRTGPNFHGTVQIFCIILILLFMWILYFDRVPHYRFGTVKQDFWMALHLPFHLAILGVVEGSQQLVQARYVYESITELHLNVWRACVGGNLDGQALASNLTKSLDYYKIDESARGTLALPQVFHQINILSNITDVCSPTNTVGLGNDVYDLPESFRGFLVESTDALVQSLNIDIPFEEDMRTIEVALHSWSVVYTYFWSAIILLETCYIVTHLLADVEHGNWRSLKRYISPSVLSRGVMVILAAIMLTLGTTNPAFEQDYIARGWSLPTVVLMLWVICICDRAVKLWKQRRRRRQHYKTLSATTTELQTCIILMTSSSEEKYPSKGPMRLTRLRVFLIPATKEEVENRLQDDQDQRKEAVWAQLFWYGVDTPHTDEMNLSGLQRCFWQAMESNKVRSFSNIRWAVILLLIVDSSVVKLHLVFLSMGGAAKRMSGE